MSFLRRWRGLIFTVVGLLLLLVVATGYAWHRLHGSLPQLDGDRVLPGLSAPVRLERDKLGVPTVTGQTRADVARAMGFLHAQDRFFQMDLMRRRGAGELAELFGPAAVALDRSARRHGFRRLAARIIEQATPEERTLLHAYTEGVNAGLAALGERPWEYLVLRTSPEAWRETDSILCIFAMWFDLQDDEGRFERNRDALRSAWGTDTMEFLAPRGNSWDAALDGSTFPAPAVPTIRLRGASDAEKSARRPADWFAPEVVGSNAFAVGGAHTVTGAGLLANDMHLNLGVPNTWYRAVFAWSDPAGAHRIAGLTLPGTPFAVVGSNGHVAWGFTNAYVDTSDVIVVEPDPATQRRYLTADGWVPFEERVETIAVKGAAAVTLTTRWTRWGPVISDLKDGRYLALAWNAHDAEATNLHLMDMEGAHTVDDGIGIAHRAGLPNENMILADAGGGIAWTIAGRIPRRRGFNGAMPVVFSFGDRGWDGWLDPAEVPVVKNPPGDAVWTGNNRALGGGAYDLLGTSGYANGARAGQIRDDLKELVSRPAKAAPADLFAVELDDRALFLERWQKFLLEVLNDEAVAQKSSRGELRTVVASWRGAAAVDSAAYRAVRAFRTHVAERALGPFFDRATEFYPDFSSHTFMFEDALWQLVHEQPARLLNPHHPTWDSLLRSAADDVLADAKTAGVSIEHFTWGRRNTLRMRHPFARLLPGFLGPLISMPAEELPGDDNMPRVLAPAFGQSERMVVSPGHESEGILEMPGGQSAHPLSPYFRAGHEAWAHGQPAPFLPGPAEHVLNLRP
ncbi:MAG TPA: penicillin acylase family protein [Candidatus Didemnitutus sp.]|nr:penicillin acylase family protein [Candidatus Didemnitutus sp.]